MPPLPPGFQIEGDVVQPGASGAANAVPPPPQRDRGLFGLPLMTKGVDAGYQDPSALAGATASTISGFVNGIPLLGPAAQRITDNIQVAGSALTGGDLSIQDLEERRRQLAEANPVADIAGNVGGSIASLGMGAATKIGAEALGLTGKFLPRVVNSTLSGGSIAAADAAVRGNDPLSAGVTGAAISGAIPIVGKAGGEIIKAIGRKSAPIIGAATDAASEAGRRVGLAYGRDVRANPSLLANAGDEAAAKASGVDFLNVDRGGETTRALGRSVANQSPEARAIIEKTASDRFAGQGGRAAAFVERMVGGKADDLALQKGIQDTARIVNQPAYRKAYTSPKAQWVFTPELQELMQSPAIQRAISMVKSRGADEAAIAGQIPVINPFRQGSDGKWRIVQKANGTLAAPNLEFWDQVQRNVRSMIGVAKRAGDDEEVRVLTRIQQKLLGSLDATVPQFKTARQGAAAFFGAEDALEAGRKFAASSKLVPEAKGAFAKFTAPEKKAFQVGYASELIDRIKSVGDRSNVINQVFKSPASREMIELVFGKAKARELEAYIRVEDIADRLRGAMGNSTTARQLMELGIGAGGGFVLTGGDWKGALGGAALAKGTRYLGQKLDDKVMQEVAKLLLSSDPAALQRAIYNATMSENWMRALEAWGSRLEIATRGASMAMAS